MWGTSSYIYCTVLFIFIPSIFLSNTTTMRAFSAINETISNGHRRVHNVVNGLFSFLGKFQALDEMTSQDLVKLKCNQNLTVKYLFSSSSSSHRKHRTNVCCIDLCIHGLLMKDHFQIPAQSLTVLFITSHRAKKNK